MKTNLLDINSIQKIHQNNFQERQFRKYLYQLELQKNKKKARGLKKSPCPVMRLKINTAYFIDNLSTPSIAAEVTPLGVAPPSGRIERSPAGNTLKYPHWPAC